MRTRPLSAAYRAADVICSQSSPQLVYPCSSVSTPFTVLPTSAGRSVGKYSFTATVLCKSWLFSLQSIYAMGKAPSFLMRCVSAALLYTAPGRFDNVQTAPAHHGIFSLHPVAVMSAGPCHNGV